MSSQVEQSKEAFHYQKYGDDLSRLFEATANLLEREWPAKYKVDSARTIFFQSVRIAINTYYTIMFISADIPKDPHRKPAFALSLAPLTRTLFEQLITFIFIIEDIVRYIPWLFKTGYTEYWIQLEHTRQYHAHDVKWDPYVKELQDQMAKVERESGLTPDEVSNPRRNIGRWPTPGGMLRILKQDHATSPAIPFIEYINSWLYRELSGQTHLNATGVTMRGSYFDPVIAKYILGEDWEEKLKEHLLSYRTKQIYIAISLMLAIASEIEGHFHFGRNERARYLWGALSEHSDIAKDFWETRYEKLLSE